MANEIEVRIEKALNDVKAWQRVPTSINGIFLVKTPEKAGKKTILVEINPEDEHGKLIKRRGLFLKSLSELEQFNNAMENGKLKEVLEAIENISDENEEEKIKPLNL
jgi:hypothetical protein